MQIFINSEGEIYNKYIYYHDGSSIDPGLKDWPEGFYFSDETETLNGPFDTLGYCELAFREYCRMFLR